MVPSGHWVTPGGMVASTATSKVKFPTGTRVPLVSVMAVACGGCGLAITETLALVAGRIR